MPDITIATERCIGCAECARDCPTGIIRMENGIPAVAPRREKRCIGCLHCVTVCPCGALSFRGVTPESCTPLKNRFPQPEALEILMKGRRSVRRFLPEAVDSALIRRTVDAAAHAPSGKNQRGLLFTVVDDPQTMNRLRHDTVEAVREALADGCSHPQTAFFQAALARWDTGTDIIFRNAPHLLWVTAPRTNTTAQADVHVALTYFELMAAACGLGTLWCGFATWAMSEIAPRIARGLGIPEAHTSGYVMLFGKPAVCYHRTAERGCDGFNRVVWPPAT